LEETYTQNRLLVGNNKQRAEARRLIDWFDNKFHHEVYQYIVGEKVYKRFALRKPPESKRIQAGINNLRFHLEYIDWIVERNNYLVGDEFSLADISAAAQLSIIDYLGDVPWEDYKNAKLWYSKIKSRPSFKEILNDRIKNIYPSTHYTDLDF
jgi:glutathione S-transferase